MNIFHLGLIHAPTSHSSGILAQLPAHAYTVCKGHSNSSLQMRSKAQTDMEDFTKNWNDHRGILEPMSAAEKKENTGKAVVPNSATGLSRQYSQQHC